MRDKGYDAVEVEIKSAIYKMFGCINNQNLVECLQHKSVDLVNNTLRIEDTPGNILS